MSTDPSGPLEDLFKVVNAFLSSAEQLTPEMIRSTIQDFRVMPGFAAVSDHDAEILARRLEAQRDVRIGDVMVLEQNHTPWLDGAKAEIDPYYWGRYRTLLGHQGWGPDLLQNMDEVSDRILDLMENPVSVGPWDRRGLVLGNVQSGKTANYLGLVCKAADAGYRVIIVIAGIHNQLRNQTQTRIDEGFIGSTAARLQSKGAQRNIVGVGRIDSTRRPGSFTSTTQDFNKAGANQVDINISNYAEPVVFVIKKNTNTLRNLIDWLKHSQSGRNIQAPMLLIDDEADNASINVSKGVDEATKINRQIRTLLNMFDRSCYVGYTATPFANIFIDPDTVDDMLGEDLFPRDFIVSLDAPSNYFGASRVFLSEEGDYVRFIEDNEDLLPVKHKKGHPVAGLPHSLLDAIRAFVLARAIRLVRGQVKSHNSMLVNASRFTDVQESLKQEIYHFLEQVKAAVRVNSGLSATLAEKDPEIAEMKRVWLQEYSDIGVAWADAWRQVNASVAPIKVVTINSNSTGELRYSESAEHGLNVIAVGGLSLSRGLTLEGLTVTYFLRNSMMYDTLMQMGRWFGYRPEYEDVCRVWMPEEAAGHYAHIAESIELLRDDLRVMERSGATPADFGLRVRSHPDALLVTARNKMRAGTEVSVRVGLANEFIETFALSSQGRAGNLEAAEHLITSIRASDCAPPDRVKQGILFTDVPSNAVIDFLERFKNDPASMMTETSPVIAHIEDRIPGELEYWDILVTSLADGGRAEPVTLGGLTVNPQTRTVGKRTSNRTVWVGNNQRISSRGIEMAGLSEDEATEARRSFEQEHPEKEGPRGWNYPDYIYRSVRKRPLLVVHVLMLTGDKRYVDTHTIAWGLSFPRTGRPEELVEYVVNGTWLREHYGDAIEEEEEAGDDDDI